MERNHTTPLSFDGACSDFLYFSALSRSRGGGAEPLVHTVVICKRSAVISCTCEDSTYRSKKAPIDSANPDLCYHSHQILRWARSVVRAMFGSNSMLEVE